MKENNKVKVMSIINIVINIALISIMLMSFGNFLHPAPLMGVLNYPVFYIATLLLVKLIIIGLAGELSRLDFIIIILTLIVIAYLNISSFSDLAVNNDIHKIEEQIKEKLTHNQKKKEGIKRLLKLENIPIDNTIGKKEENIKKEILKKEKRKIKEKYNISDLTKEQIEKGKESIKKEKRKIKKRVMKSFFMIIAMLMSFVVVWDNGDKEEKK